MSKVAAITQRALSAPFASKAEALGNAEMILTGKRTISRVEAQRLFGDASDELEVQFKRLNENMLAVGNAELEVSKNTRAMISRAKDLAGQVGDSMARIDKVVVRDFESKLAMLERFVVAMKDLDDLNRSGRLGSVINAFRGTP